MNAPPWWARQLLIAVIRTKPLRGVPLVSVPAPARPYEWVLLRFRSIDVLGWYVHVRPRTRLRTWNYLPLKVATERYRSGRVAQPAGSGSRYSGSANSPSDVSKLMARAMTMYWSSVKGSGGRDRHRPPLVVPLPRRVPTDTCCSPRRHRPHPARAVPLFGFRLWKMCRARIRVENLHERVRHRDVSPSRFAESFRAWIWK